MIEKLIQIKEIDQQNVIYCPFNKITVYNRTSKCPNFPFALPLSTPFRVGKLVYTVDKLKLSSSLPFVDKWSSRINYHLVNSLYPSQKFEAPDLDFLEGKNNDENEKKIIFFR